MNRAILLALVVVASATFNVANAAPGKKDKKKKQQPTEQVAEPELTLQSASDSLSYAAGKAYTMGLQQFLQQQYGVSASDTGFIEGFKYGVSMASGKSKAYNAGIQIALMMLDRMVPQVNGIFDGTPYSIDDKILYTGFEDALSGNNKLMTDSAAEKLFNDRRIAVTTQKEQAYKAENQKWLDDNKAKEGVVVLPSGLQYKVLTQGAGPVATATDEVEVKYEGKTIDGTVFDSSYKRNPQTNTFRPNQVIKGWTEALTMMPEGSVWELYIPENLAYGNRAAGKIKPYSTLIFKVELIKVKHQEPKAEAKPQPKQPAKAAPKAVKTAKKAKAGK